MKKILLLGGSAQQIVAIETSKKLGYYTVLCDYLPDNPGQYYADKFYLASTTDKEMILKIAKDENVDGILAFASDPAAPTAAYVAERLGLPTNAYRSVEILCNKDQFRAFLKENGFHAPQAKSYCTKEIPQEDLHQLHLPVIVKPVDSSGSKGATVLYAWEKLEAAVEFALSFSRSNRIIIEEFIEKKHPYLIGGDIFINDGEVVLWGLLNCHRDSAVNSLVPIGKSYPLQLEDQDIQNVKDTLTGIVKALNLRFGSVNVELVVDKNGDVWPIDIGPRAGGNMIPDLLGMMFGVDIVKMAVLAAMGESVDCSATVCNGYFATHNLHSALDGTYQAITFSEELEPYIIKKCFYKKEGDQVYYFDNAAKALGIIFIQFPDAKTQNRILERINEHIQIQLT